MLTSTVSGEFSSSPSKKRTGPRPSELFVDPEDVAGRRSGTSPETLRRVCYAQAALIALLLAVIVYQHSRE
jgi:hypothetical protein